MSVRIFPVRCFTCNAPLSGLEDDELRLRRAGHSCKGALDALGYERACCRTAMMTTISHEHNQQRTRQNVAEFSEGRVNVESPEAAKAHRVYSTD